MLSIESKKCLLTLARNSIIAKLTGGVRPKLPVSTELTVTGGIFVTLHLNGDLRGCIGMIESNRPIAESVRDMAVQAAFHDPRFSAITTDELETVKIEISILTPPSEIEDYNDISLGIDGVILENRGHRALFLPQVATEQGWDLETTLMYLSSKAGLNSNAWQDPGTRFKIFQAEYFDESN